MASLTLACALGGYAQRLVDGRLDEGRPVKSVQPIQLILDSDFGSSTDDLFALMMLNHYIDDGIVDLKGIIVDREGEKNAGVVDIFNTYYGHPDIPVGLERNGVKSPRCFIPYNGICDLKDAQGKPLFKRSLDVSKLPDGYKLYRKLLSKAEDNSIVIVAIGFVTTLSQLFESGADEYSDLSGLDLFKQKVKSVYIQSGRFEAGDSLSGYNMRAASKQSALFYNKFPEKVDLVMSPSNIGDKMNYLPQDVLVDLSYTDWNPIKSVYTNYTCDTGQRMWDTNCLVNAVLGDKEYHLSPRGRVLFVDKGEMSEMLFTPDPNGNARYQMPGDSYYFMEKLMDIRRHNRINKYPSRYTIEAPQPTLLSENATEWAKPRTGLLIDKYLATAGNRLDPNEFRTVFQPIGYYGGNVAAYREAENIAVDSLYAVMLDRALRAGKKTMTIVTGAPGAGKSTVVSRLGLKDEGLIYDATLAGGTSRLERVIQRAKDKGMKKITVVPVYNDVITCFRNTISSGKNSNRFCTLDNMLQSFNDSKGKVEWIQHQHPEINIIPMNNEGNKGPFKVGVKEAKEWNYEVSEDQVYEMLNILSDVIESGELWEQQLPSLVGEITAIPDLSNRNRKLAQKISDRVEEILHNYRN
ncbi:MAG: hypothetical protein K6A32_09515 [Bacteroidales bacterium]|nr:hypothetical protein [Bacteroidales bacterium]